MVGAESQKMLHAFETEMVEDMRRVQARMVEGMEAVVMSQNQMVEGMRMLGIGYNMILRVKCTQGGASQKQLMACVCMARNVKELRSGGVSPLFRNFVMP